MAESSELTDSNGGIVACTISRDVQNFELLIEDMEAELGDRWGDLSIDDAGTFLDQAEAANVQFVAIALDAEDEENLAKYAEVIRKAATRGVKVIVIAEEVSPIVLHQLLRAGAQEFVPYPLPDGALHDAIVRVTTEPVAAVEAGAKPKSKGNKEGVILAVHGLCGGVGSTTFAVNLAWELANIDRKEPVKICLIDLDLQFGSVATYLDLPRREGVFEMLSDTANLDGDSLTQAMVTFQEKLQVLTAPADILPLDIINSEDVNRILEVARTHHDYVVVDMPHTMVQWTEAVIHASHVYFALMEMDMRSAQNALRTIRAFKGEELPVEKMRYVINRGPGMTDLTGKSRIKRLAESLDIAIELQLPDGGKQILTACDNGTPLADVAAKNPLRKEIQKLALSVHALNQSVSTKAA
jgi:pilus assembly protein CpaE